MANNQRFWIWYRSGWVRLAMAPGDTLNFGYSEPTEEGYSFLSETLYFTKDGLTVEREIASGGRDCDGVLNNYRSLECPASRLQALQGGERPAPGVPDWQLEGERVYDQYAVAAGY